MKQSPILNHPGQKKLWLSKARFKVCPAGRRFGKTFYAKERLASASCNRRHLYWYVAPTRGHAKELLWEELKSTFRYYGWAYGKNESELRLWRIKTQTEIVLKSAEKPDRLRGKGLNGAILDEFADQKKVVWTEAVRPALSDRRGWADFIGTPKGFTYFYDLFQEAKTRDNWEAFHFKTVDSPYFQTPEGLQELEDARLDLDERTFRQEYEASFENFAGRIIYAFDRKTHHADYQYDPTLDIYVGQDFNRHPMAGVLFQKVNGKMIAFDEMVIPTSSTPEICRIIKQRYPKWSDNRVIFRPDMTGKRHYSSGGKSDHEQIKEAGFLIDGPTRNPNRVDRWAATNRAFERMLVLINTNKCPKFTKELETICYKEGTCEALITDKLTGHTFDGGQYNICREFPIMKKQKPPRIQRY